MSRFLLLGGSILLCAFAAGELNADDNPPLSKIPSIASQESSTVPAPGIQSQSGSSEPLEIKPQSGGETMLEIAPQPGSTSPGLSTDDGGRKFRTSDNAANLNRDFRTDRQAELQKPLEVSSPRQPVSLGAVIEYHTHCYLGMEEHGLEVVSVDPGG